VRDLLTASATRLAKRIRDGEVTSRQVVEAHIRQVERVNPALNAMVRDRFTAARIEAQQADAALRTAGPETLPPLHGVPCTIKEAFALEGMPNCSGLVARKEYRSEADATGTGRYRGAGAIPLGVTNVSELCMWMESANFVYGRTNNPYDGTRIVGGSSGGEAALVASGAAPFGLASDVGGSIRMPAFFNGVFGHKPTGGLVPNTGQYPNGVHETARYLTTGPICRRAEDLMPLLRILAGPDGKDPGCIAWGLGDPGAVDLSRLRVFDVPDNGILPVHPDLRRAQRAAARALADGGALVVKRRLRGLRESLPIWSSMLHLSGGPTFKELLGEGRPINAGAHLALRLAGMSPHTLPAIGLGLLESLQDLLPGLSRRAMRKGLALKREVAELLGNDGVMLYPSYTAPAPPHNRPLMPPFNWVYTAVFNALELPVTQVPLGLNDRGLPLGVQVAGSHGNDHVTIAVGMHLERMLGGWVPPHQWLAPGP
jgi:fatty acid amide hydrolase 2